MADREFTITFTVRARAEYSRTAIQAAIDHLADMDVYDLSYQCNPSKYDDGVSLVVGPVTVEE